jgi:hypothetical protein
MMLRIAFQIFLLLAPVVQSPTTPLRTGVVARQLTDQDIAELEMVLPTGSTPWLLNGERPQDIFVDYIEAYLSPTSTGSALRRGTIREEVVFERAFGNFWIWTAGIRWTVARSNEGG